MSGWTDSHCHIYDLDAHGDADPAAATAAVEDAAAAGVGTLVVVGCDRASSLAALAVARVHPNVYATVGLHPHEARHGVDTIADLLPGGGADSHDGVVRPVAIGECGLDYHYDHSPRPVQRDVFAAQIDLANEHAMALVIHTREAWTETFEILDACGMPERVVFHCFTGGPDEAAECLRRGAHLSFSGIVTFPSAADVRAAAAVCPLERTLIETDSPYLAPVPHRGRRNRPALLPFVGAAIADVHGVPVDVVRAATAAATSALFGFDD